MSRLLILGHGLLYQRLHRAESGAAGDEHQVTAGLGRQRHRAVRGAEQQRVTDLGVPDQRAAHPAGGQRADVEAEQAVGARRVGDRVRPPDPGPARGLDGDELAGPVHQRLPRPHGEDGEVGGSQFVFEHLGHPPGRLLGGLGRLDHDPGRRREDGGPGRLDLGGPGVGGEPPHGGKQRGADGGIVLGHHPEPAVVAAEPAEVVRELVGAVEAEHDPAQGLEQLLSLSVERRREQRPEAWILGEQTTTEIGGRLFRLRLDMGKTLFYHLGIQRHRQSRPTLSEKDCSCRLPVVWSLAPCADALNRFRASRPIVGSSGI